MIRSIERAANVSHRNCSSYKVNLKKFDKNVKKHCIEIKKNLEGKINKRPGWDKNKKKEELEALTRILSNYEDDIIKSLYIIEFYLKFLDAEERDYLKMTI